MENKPFISITGIEVGNPKICIKGSNFACVCPECTKSLLATIDRLYEQLVKSQLIDQK